MSEVFSGQFFINVATSFNGEITSLSELAAMPQPTGTNITVARVPNSQLIGSDAEFTYSDSQALGWDPNQWNKAYGSQGQRALTGAWSGGAYSSQYRRMLLNGYGHDAGGWNAVFSFNLNTMSWERVNNPSRRARASTSPYEDGTPPASHTYSHLVVDPVQNTLVDPYLGVFSPTNDTDPGTNGGRGLFSVLPLGDIFTGAANISQELNDLEANLYKFQSFWPEGTYQSMGATDFYENSFGVWDSTNSQLLMCGPARPRTYPGYDDGTYTDGSGYVSYTGGHTNAGNHCTIYNPNNQELWTAFWNDGPTLRISDMSNYLVSGELAPYTVDCTGDDPWIHDYSFDRPADKKNFEAFDTFAAFAYDTTNNRAIWWRPMYETKAGDYIDPNTSQPFTEAFITAQNLQFTEVRDDYECRNLTVVENANATMPRWGDSFSDNEWASGGPYNRFAYIEEYDVFIYIHSTETDVLFLKFPPVA